MEELLNKLIEKGWKPRGKGNENGIEYELHIQNLSYTKKVRVWLERLDSDFFVYSYRELVSKESGLWQFVCKNELLNIKKEKKRITPEHLRVFNGEYQYRLIESALCDENKIEDFLLSNIKVEGEEQRHS